jgi:hypothetical protein
MAEAETLRFEDWYRYDVINDRQVVRLLGITGKGTFSSELSYKTAEDLRQKRKDFREYVTDCIYQNIEPHEFDMEQDPEIVKEYW